MRLSWIARRGRRAPARAVTVALALCAFGLVAAAGARASVPSVSTGSARQVSFATATLTGTINPRGEDTSYFFQYGLTRAYGLQTGVADAGAGTGTVHVSLPIGGLQPVTRYHFRLVAVNASGASSGSDVRFTTAKVPLSLAILVAPNPVLFGGNVFVEGTLSGTGNGGVVVALQANPFPYLQGFVNVGNPVVTLPNGGFTFFVPGLTEVTQFRVVATSGHKVVSLIAVENVAVRVTSHLAPARRRHFARVYGTVTPAEDGAEVGILRIVHGRGVLVGGTHLRHRDPSSSSFSRVVHVSRGVYRVLV